MDENTFDKVVDFFMSFVVDFCKKSTARELPTIMNVMAVYNMFGNRQHQNYAMNQQMNDQQLSECVRRGLEYVKAVLRQMQSAGEGIPVTGGSIESWRFENISLDIISQDTRLHNTADFHIEGINLSLSEGKIHVGVRWPMAHLTETYILRGSVDNKRVYGAGRFRISVVNFTMTSLCYFVEEESTIRMRSIVLASDFEDAQINISGLEVEGNDNAEQLMNNAIQRDKQKFREILHRNMEALSKEVLVVLNLHLSQTHKNSVYELIASWCRL